MPGSEYGDGRLLSFIHALFDDQDVPTLELANSIEVTPDGQHVMATAISDSALNLFTRDAQGGEITFVESLVDTTGPCQIFSWDITYLQRRFAVASYIFT